MKKIVIIRHAKAEKGGAGMIDFERDLTDIGIEDAVKAGKLLEGSIIDHPFFLSSPAKRTRHTAGIIAQHIGFNPGSIVFDQRIYQANPETLAELICEIPESNDWAILVGHNPSVHQLAMAYASYDIELFPTCTLAGLIFETNTWSEVRYGKGDLFMLEYPHYT
jgi:phosphohistidine phosphatase